MYGLLISRKWCTGCHSCEMACQVEHGYPSGQGGIRLAQFGPWKMDNGKWNYTFEPVPTRQCDLCANRIAEGKLPTCVHHCQARCIEFGKVEDLAEKLKSMPESSLYTI